MQNEITINAAPEYKISSREYDAWLAAQYIAEKGDSKKTRWDAKKFYRGEVSAELIAIAHFSNLLGLKKLDFYTSDEACDHANKWAADANISARAVRAEIDHMHRTTSFVVVVA